jgi:hypothetical protein
MSVLDADDLMDFEGGGLLLVLGVDEQKTTEKLFGFTHPEWKISHPLLYSKQPLVQYHMHVLEKKFDDSVKQAFAPWMPWLKGQVSFLEDDPKKPDTIHAVEALDQLWDTFIEKNKMLRKD